MTTKFSASTFISLNRDKACIGSKGDNNYYNVFGIVWEVWQDGCGNYPTSTGIKVEDFQILNN